MKGFETYHPLVLFCYFIAVIGITMFFMHPVYIALSAVAAIIMCTLLFGTSFLKGLWRYAFLFIAMAVVNPIITHRGERILFYVNNNPVTLEAITYGIVVAFMLIAVIWWFNAYNDVMTSDKFIYLFGRIIPVFALVLSITLRLVPRFKQQAREIATAQRTIGMDYTSGSLWHRVRSVTRVFSVLLTWALENTLDSADAMKARGYGLRGRTTFSLFRFERRDTIVLSLIIILAVGVFIGGALGKSTFYFYPTFSTLTVTWDVVLFYGLFVALLAIPILIEVRERWRWQLLKSTM